MQRRLAGPVLPIIALGLFAALLSPVPAVSIERIAFDVARPAGSIVVATARRRLYLVLGDGTALVYPVAVGKPGKQWAGTKVIDAKYVDVAWSPPADVKRDNPSLPDVIPPGPRNPMGARVLSLGPGPYAIHGTNRPESIGTFASYGCIRMHNRDIVDLYERVKVGAIVTVVR